MPDRASPIEIDDDPRVQNAFSGRVVVVTGAARGIGDAIVAAFLEQGATCVVLDVIEPPAPRPGVRYLATDVSDPGSVRSAFASVDEVEERVDVLVNNAGIQRVGMTGELEYERWAEVIGTHLTGTFLCCSESVPRMKRVGGGAIVNISSAAAFVGIPGRAPYCAAKAGILGYARSLAVELASASIRVNSVAPGYTRTGLVEEAIREGYQREDRMLERVPLGRMATPEEIARVVRFLASDEAAYVTGQVVVADGGWTIQGVGWAPDWLSAGGADRSSPGA